jgi:hypothetical protein
MPGEDRDKTKQTYMKISSMHCMIVVFRLCENLTDANVSVRLNAQETRRVQWIWGTRRLFIKQLCVGQGSGVAKTASFSVV